MYQACVRERSVCLEFVIVVVLVLMFVNEQEDARRRLRGMCGCKKELRVCWMAMERKNCMCRRDGDVLLTTNTLEDELHTRVPLLLKTKLTSTLPPYMLGVWGSSLKFAFLY